MQKKNSRVPAVMQTNIFFYKILLKLIVVFNLLYVFTLAGVYVDHSKFTMVCFIPRILETGISY